VGVKEGNLQLHAPGLLAAAGLAPVPVLRLPPDSPSKEKKNREAEREKKM